MSEPIFPTVHINGTSAKCLFDGYLSAYRAANDLLDVCADKIEFNGRDYYPQGPEAFTKAQAERRKHLKAISDARDYFLAHAEHVQQFIKE